MTRRAALDSLQRFSIHLNPNLERKNSISPFLFGRFFLTCVYIQQLKDQLKQSTKKREREENELNFKKLIEFMFIFFAMFRERVLVNLFIFCSIPYFFMVS